MKVIGVKNYKPVGVMSELQEFDVPTPNPVGHDLLVKVKAVATNPIDYKKLANLGNSIGPVDSEESPLVVGWDAAGVVEQVGSEVTLFGVGDHVMFAGDFFRPGAYAEYTLVDERIVGRKPRNVTWSQAAALPLTTLTAWESLVDQMRIPMTPETNGRKTVLIIGGGGGVASAAVEIAKRVLGLTVIATGSRPESVAHIQLLGADHVINHHEKLLPQLRHLGINQVDYVLDGFGLSSDIFADLTDMVTPLGHIVSVWPAAQADLMKLFWKSIHFSALCVFTLPILPDERRRRRHATLTTIAELVETGILTSKETDTCLFSVDTLALSLIAQANKRVIGKRTLKMD